MRNIPKKKIEQIFFIYFLHCKIASNNVKTLREIYFVNTWHIRDVVQFLDVIHLREGLYT
jgi:hypothetical protein